MLNAVDAAERGASIRTRTRLVRADRQGELWQLVLNARGKRETVTARALVNAAGAWVPEVADHMLRLPPSGHVRLVKGSHIVVPRLFEHDHAYIFQNADGRIVFAIPYEHDYTLIGTTDEDFRGDLSTPTASAAEINYLCGAVSTYFRKGVTPDQVVHQYSGVRQLYDDGARSAQNLTREYLLDLDGKPREAPLLTVYGGKITTYRTLAEAALAKLAPVLAARPAVDRRTRRCRAGTFRMTASMRSSPARAGCGRSSPSRMRGGSSAPTARGSTGSSVTHATWARSANASAPI